ncbi:MAG: hypothetical protein K9J16_14165 [Melioribacteraceae bacterium]|nr:hypothetical protein [Melioribacteraceae bacterium]MCF8355664.1 hypothetical protein [Melioribacteraceae bacterium]MCF8395134.1 hypothetical protein [Melioribacteraceae bacterium]MCF8420572.1 hypothetical protein [Melioribacteraceae bacterium]
MQKKFVYILVGVSVLLLIINVSLEIYNKPDDVKILTEIRTKTIEEKFEEVLAGFGIEESWIEKKIIENKNYDSLNQVYYVKIPKQLPIPMILKDISKAFDKDPVEFKIEEKISGGNTVLQVISGENVKLYSYLNVDEKAVRKSNKLAFIVVNISANDESGFLKLMQMHFPLTVMITPSIENENVVKLIKDSGKWMSVEISDRITDDKYELNVDDSKDKIKRSIKNIVSQFGTNSIYFIDMDSKIFNSILYNFLKDELSSYKIELRKRSEFIILPSGNNVEVKSIFKFHAEDGNESNKAFIIDHNDLENMIPIIEEYLKKGFEFYPAQSLVNE